MKSKYQLIGFVNLFSIIPDFVLPVFKKGNELYFQEGEKNCIKKFGKVKKNIVDKVIRLENISFDRSVIKSDIDSQPIYAFQESEQTIIYGTASKIKKYFNNFTPLNNILESEIADFLEDISSNNKYSKKLLYCGTGRIRNSTAQVKVYHGRGTIRINGRDIDNYFPNDKLKLIVLQPLNLTNLVGKFDIECKVAGGSVIRQSVAIRHGLSRALLQYSDELRPTLREAGLLTHSPRLSGIKKYGHKSARYLPQFLKK